MSNKTFQLGVMGGKPDKFNGKRLTNFSITRSTNTLDRIDNYDWRCNLPDEERRARTLKRFSGNYIGAAANLAKLGRFITNRRTLRILKNDICYFWNKAKPKGDKKNG
jgi:hypothetical protein